MMFKSNLLDNHMFSTFLNIETKESYIYFGGYEENMINDVTWMDMDQEKLNHWNVYFDWIFLKGERGISIKNTESILDTGTTLMYFSKSIYDEIIDKLTGNLTCKSSDGLVYCNSSIDLPNLYFSIRKGHSYELKSEDYGIYYND